MLVDGTTSTHRPTTKERGGLWEDSDKQGMGVPGEENHNRSEPAELEGLVGWPWITKWYLKSQRWSDVWQWCKYTARPVLLSLQQVGWIRQWREWVTEKTQEFYTSWCFATFSFYVWLDPFNYWCLSVLHFNFNKSLLDPWINFIKVSQHSALITFNYL